VIAIRCWLFSLLFGAFLLTAPAAWAAPDKKPKKAPPSKAVPRKKALKPDPKKKQPVKKKPRPTSQKARKPKVATLRKPKLSAKDREIIKNMEMLRILAMLKNMDLLTRTK